LLEPRTTDEDGELPKRLQRRWQLPLRERADLKTWVFATRMAVSPQGRPTFPIRCLLQRWPISKEFHIAIGQMWRELCESDRFRETA